MNPAFRYDTPPCSSSSMMTSSGNANLLVEASPPIERRSLPFALVHASSGGNCSTTMSSKVTLSDIKMERKTEIAPARGFAVPRSLANLKADLLSFSAASSSSNPSVEISSTSRQANSKTDADFDPVSTEDQRDTVLAVAKNRNSDLRNPPWRIPPRPRVRLRLRPRSYKETQSHSGEHQDRDLRPNPTVPLHRPQKQQRNISRMPRGNNTDAKHPQDQQHSNVEYLNQTNDHHLLTEEHLSRSSAQSTLPPQWTKGFAQGVTDSVKEAVDCTISRGRLLSEPKRKFWSSFLPQDIVRSSSSNNSGKDKNGNSFDDDDVLGAGSFSKVTRVRIKEKRGNNANLVYAMKHLKGDLLPSRLTEHSCKNGSVIAFTKAATELAREAYLLSRFDHPHIINIMGWTDGGVSSYSTYRRHDAYFLVLELLQEETLDDRIEGWNQDDAQLKNMACSKDEIKAHFHQRKIEQLTVCRQVASALEYIHSKNVVYRDLKPQNIGFARVDNGGDDNRQDIQGNITVKLMDFGLARELPSTGSIPSPSYAEQEASFRSHTHNKKPSLFDMTGTVGTMRYMAPEVCLNRPYGLECDIYSWSIVAHEVLSQTKPYDDMTPDMYQSLVCQQGVRPHKHEMLSEYTILLTQAWRTDPAKRLPLNRIQRQLDLFLQQENLVWEVQELITGMPEKSESPIFLSQSYSDDNTRARHGSHHGGGGGGRMNKRSWYRANADHIQNGNSNNSSLFPNASMDCHAENREATISYGNNRHDHTNSIGSNSMCIQRGFVVRSLSPSSRVPETTTTRDRYYFRQPRGQTIYQTPRSPVPPPPGRIETSWRRSNSSRYDKIYINDPNSYGLPEVRSTRQPGDWSSGY